MKFAAAGCLLGTGDPEAGADFTQLIKTVAERLRAGDSVAVHCRAGIGRAGLAGACILGVLGVAPDSAFANAEPCPRGDSSGYRRAGGVGAGVYA